MVNFCVKKNTNYTLTVSKASYITHTETINVSSDTIKNITLQPEFTPTTTRFDYTGAVQTYTVPTGTTKLIVDCVGAAGGRAMSASSTYTDRAKGGRVQCKLTVSAGQILNIYVGGVGGDGYYVTSASTGIKQSSGGWNGGGNADNFGYIYSSYNTKSISSGSAGGGASDIRIGGTALSNRKIVAGAGGGTCYFDQESYYSTYIYTLIGGAGGGTTGGTGEVYNSSGASAGKGGTQSAGGAQGADYTNRSTAAGSLGQGGNGHNSDGGSCGGGAGYYGGGAGGSAWVGAGGGGSSYTDSSLCSEVTHTQGYSSATGNGWIIITTSNE